MKRRVVRREVPVAPRQFPQDLHPVLARIYAARDIRSATELDYSLARLYPYHLLSGLDQAVALLTRALEQQQRILVVADFDADGATSCAVAVRGLRAMGVRHVDYVVPNRFEYGYGLTPEIVAVAAQRSPDLIVTVDNGVSSLEGVAAARARGIGVLVTDHHLPGRLLPEADAMVNPNQPGDAFPSKSLAGVGVIFYVLLALRAHLREAGYFQKAGIEEPNLAQFLDLVALGTVADLVPLDSNNRILVAQGLRRIRNGRCQSGVRALLKVAGRSAEHAVSGDLAYAVGPRLNAAGRLTDMTLGIECLLADDETSAGAAAGRLDQLNRERRKIEAGMHAQAAETLRKMRLAAGDSLPFGLCLFDHDWHQGVIGIVASRIKEQVHRPVIAFARNGESELKGSARSIGGVHIRDVLEAVAAEHPHLVKRFGGHAMAAGLSLEPRNVDRFREAFDAEIRRRVSAEELKGALYSDGELAPEELDLGFAELLREAGPWGQAFPEPVFDGTFEVHQQRVVGERHLKLSLGLPGHRRRIDAIAFNATGSDGISDAARAFVAYRLDVNLYRGVKNPQLVVEHIEPSRD